MASSSDTQPAVGPPSVLCTKNAEPPPGTLSLFTPITMACLYCGIGRFSLCAVLNGHSALAHCWCVL
ncbi:Uncharacterised protein [Mycobacteroides abscessus subsp. abscessus]|nr:Uncharacterised protein [Mycobacteroides abscessus subsp. abscessus]